MSPIPRIATRLVHRPPVPGEPARATSTPIYQTATFALEPDGAGRWDYSRSGNPTRDVLEAQLAALDGAAGSLASASGMAALTAVLRLVPPGGRVVAGRDLYGGTSRLLDHAGAAAGLRVTTAAGDHLAALAEAVGAGADLVLVETPTNPRLTAVPIPELAGICRQAGALLAVDNSLLSSFWQRPLELGADLAVQSATKLLAGHSDLTAGVVSARDADLLGRLAFRRNAEGTALGPFESWLLLRGLDTLAVRLPRQAANARALTRRLRSEPAVSRLHRPPGEPRGSVLSLETGRPDLSLAFLRHLELFRLGVSFGGVTSSACLPARTCHAAVPAAERERRGLGEDLVRLSVGIEDADDLAADLARAFERAKGEVR
ncbi:MAG TPA: PLP-dependent transferase [Thermoanaerobaculia bacterium]|nr:PLP-dependent transferase [Thermoanaerobaculia bacterium]